MLLMGGFGVSTWAVILLALVVGCGGSGKNVKADAGSEVAPDSGAGDAPTTDGGPSRDPIVQLGEMQTLLADGNALGLHYFPDEGTSILSYDPFRLMIADGYAMS
jgi:hypothetical protein